jgi:putative ATP-dependent endonuclease of OLD family
MRIATLKISNFRSFGPQPQVLHFDYKLNCFIGLNSAGKTAAMAALQKLLGSRSERMISREDFHIAHDQDPADEQDKALSVEAIIIFDQGDEAIPEFFKDMVIQAPGQPPCMRICMEASWTPSASSMEGEIDVSQYIVLTPEGEAVDGQSKKEFPKFMFSLFQVIYVPALRKTADQLRYASGSILHRLLKTVEYSNEFRDNFKDLTDEMNTMFQEIPSFKSIQDSLHNIWSSFHKDNRYQDANMSFGSGELEEILRKLEVNFTPGPGHHRRFGVDDLGDGYRSMFYLSLVCTLLEIEDSLPADTEIDGNLRPLLTILAVEEPENHIAPQLLGRVIKILEKIAVKANTQVFFTSHTPAIVKRVDPEMIYHFRITDEATTAVNRVTLPKKTDEAYKYVKEAVQNYPEIYFAKLVMIGEGDSEEVVFNHLTRVLNTNFDDNIISFAPLGHRFVSHIWKLLSTLNIPHVTLLDLDLERDGGGWGRIKYVLNELIDIGIDRNELLETTKGVLSDDMLQTMHTWDNKNQETLLGWIDMLKQHNVYYSAPLDLDFLLLEAFEPYYTKENAYPKGGGPRFTDKDAKPEWYAEYLTGAITATLKNEKAKGELYTEVQHKLMIWYKYHFLGRGKPVTHLQVLSHIPDKTLEEELPAVLKEVFVRIKELLS